MTTRSRALSSTAKQWKTAVSSTIRRTTLRVAHSSVVSRTERFLSTTPGVWSCCKPAPNFFLIMRVMSRRLIGFATVMLLAITVTPSNAKAQESAQPEISAGTLINAARAALEAGEQDDAEFCPRASSRVRETLTSWTSCTV